MLVYVPIKSSTAWFSRRNVIAELYSAVTAVVGLVSIVSVFVKTCKTYEVFSYALVASLAKGSSTTGRSLLYKVRMRL